MLSRSAAAASSEGNPLATLLDSDKSIFGVFSGEKTSENARALATNDLVDFVFYDMEHGPFDVAGMSTFIQSLGVRPIVTRLPPIRDGFDQARDHTKALVGAGVQGVVFPHVENREQAEQAVRSMGETSAVNILLIEDKMGIANAREIVSVPGVDIVFPGPGDLRRAYEGDGEAIESAIQTVLAACKEFDVVCGITAGPRDVEKRLEEGFRVIITTSPDTLPIGRKAAGR